MMLIIQYLFQHTIAVSRNLLRPTVSAETGNGAHFPTVTSNQYRTTMKTMHYLFGVFNSIAMYSFLNVVLLFNLFNSVLNLFNDVEKRNVLLWKYLPISG